MPWISEGNNLRLIGDLHFSETKFQELIEELSNTQGNKPEIVCSKLEDGVNNKLVSKNTIWQFSKWCDWSRKKPERIAREIGDLLFGRYPQPRFLDQNDNPMPEAQDHYQEWVQWIVDNNSSPKLTGIHQALVLLENKKQIIFYGPPGTGKTFSTKRIAIDLLEKMRK